MNIITVPYGSKGFYARPDTSLNRDSNDYFCPEEATELAAAVFIYAKAAKAGKCVASKFAGRYYCVVGKGIHLSAPSFNDGTPEGWWTANSLDSSTFITEEMPAENASTEEIEKLNAAIEIVSKYVSFRTGDYIAVEIGPSTELKKGESSFTCNNTTINIIW